MEKKKERKEKVVYFACFVIVICFFSSSFCLGKEVSMCTAWELIFKILSSQEVYYFVVS